MKTSLLVIAVAAASLTGAVAENTWTYDFGTGVGSFTNANSASTNFLPAPPSGGGTARLRVGTNGGGFTLVNAGSGSSLVGNASSGTGTSVDKVSIFGFSNPTTAFSVKFDVKFSGASNGVWSFFAGSGATYGNNADFANPQSFAGLRWSSTTNGGILSSNRSASSWKALPALGLTQDAAYELEVLGNNGPDPITYRGAFTLNPGTYDVWVNNSLASSGLAKAGLTNGVAIDSFMFYGENSPGNAATIELDNIVYANHVVPEPSRAALLAVAAVAVAGWMRLRKSPGTRF